MRACIIPSGQAVGGEFTPFYPLSGQPPAKTRKLLGREFFPPQAVSELSVLKAHSRKQRPNISRLRAPARRDGNPMREGLSKSGSVSDLVTRARTGDEQAWDTLVDRYAPLIWSICRRHGLGRADAEDVAQAVWLHLVGHLGNLHEPAALPGWLLTTTQRECVRVLRAARPLATGPCAGCRDPPRQPGQARRAGDAGGRTSRGAARGAR